MDQNGTPLDRPRNGAVLDQSLQNDVHPESRVADGASYPPPAPLAPSAPSRSFGPEPSAPAGPPPLNPDFVQLAADLPSPAVPTSTAAPGAPVHPDPRAAVPTTVAQQTPAGAVNNMVHHRDVEDHDDFYGDADDERRGGSNSCCLIGAIVGVVLAFGVVAGVGGCGYVLLGRKSN